MSSTSLGPNVLLQSFRVSRRFFIQDEPGERYFIPEGARDEEAPSLRRVTNLGWDAGYAFTLLNGVALDEQNKDLDSYLDMGHAFMLGMNWAFLPRCELLVDAVYNRVADENLKQGGLFTRIEYYFPLGRRTAISPEIERRRKKPTVSAVPAHEAGPNEEEPISYPNLRASLNLDFHKHIKGTTTAQDARSARAAAVAQDQILNTYATGLELIYESDARDSFSVGGNYYRYNRENVESFINLNDVGPQNARGTLHLAGLSGYVSQLMTFPRWHFTQSYALTSSDVWAFEMILGETSFAYGSPVLISLSPVFYKSLGAQWNMGIGTELAVGGGLYFLGSLQLSRFF